MAELEDLIHYAYPHILEVGFSSAITDAALENMKTGLQSTVIDKVTLELMELPELFRTVDYTRSTFGKRVLFRSMVQPLTSVDLINAKQESLREIGENVELRNKLHDYVLSLAEKEDYLIRYFFSGRGWSEPSYPEYSGTKVFFERMVDGIKKIPELETPYLQTLANDIRDIEGKRVFELIRGPVYLTRNGLKTGSEVGRFTPRIKFTLRPIKPTLVASVLLGNILTGAALLLSDKLPTIQLAGGALAYSLMFGMVAIGQYPENFDKGHFIMPLRDIYKIDENLRRGIEAVGKIDELLSFHDYSKTLGNHVTIPLVTDKSPHYMIAKGAVNPLLMSVKNNNPYCVPNDIKLDGQKLTLITGSNSGGKTIYSKTIAQIQALAQIGSPVSAKEAEMSIAENISYNLPQSGKTKDKEGDLGVELKRLREIFFNTTPRSLVVWNESLAGLTTHKEGVKTSYDILFGFHTKGNNTILITHNTDLVKRLQREYGCKCLQVEFRKGAPTYSLIPGISASSHADVVARRVLFSRDDIDDHLQREGYLK